MQIELVTPKQCYEDWFVQRRLAPIHSLAKLSDDSKDHPPKEAELCICHPCMDRVLKDIYSNRDESKQEINTAIKGTSDLDCHWELHYHISGDMGLAAHNDIGCLLRAVELSKKAVWLDNRRMQTIPTRTPLYLPEA